MDEGKYQRSFVDEYLRVSPDGLHVNLDLLNGSLKRYQFDGKRIFSDREVERVKAQMVVAALESQFQDTRATKLGDKRLLAQVELMGPEKLRMKFPLSEADRNLERMNQVDFDYLVNGARGRHEVSKTLFAKLQLALAIDSYYRDPSGSVKVMYDNTMMERDGPRRFDRSELEISLRRAEELRSPTALRELSKEELRFMEYELDPLKQFKGYQEVEARRDARHHVAHVQLDHDKFVDQVFRRFPAQAKIYLPEEMQTRLDMLGQRLQAGLKASGEYLTMATGIAMEVPEAWRSKIQFTDAPPPSFTEAQARVINECAKIQDDPTLSDRYARLLQKGEVRDFFFDSYSRPLTQRKIFDGPGEREVGGRGGQ